MDSSPQTQSDGTGAIPAEKTATGGDTASGAAISITEREDTADLAAARAGDDDAFARIYDRLAPVVLSLCRQRSLAEADDATQETFIRAHRLLHKVDSPQRLRPWLYAIARRVCSERNRAARRRSRHEENFALSREEVQTPPGRAGQTTVARTDDPSGQTEQAEQLDRLGDAMEKLDARERLAIHIYYLEADPVKAATTALDLSRSGYYKLLTRARDHLASLMK
jgi:RNA polymerase sigma-70 factor (ECF subfamily)